MGNLEGRDGADKARPPLRLTIPLERGELRLSRDGSACELQTWTQYPGGYAMMAGGLRLHAQDLRLAVYALRYCLWDLERHESSRLRGVEDAAA